ncbi:hypothetical protein Q5P01_014283 [Channa striata]|uniref:E3 ubiquitin-protein ligase n=1 Tax=Channa striata TaxID=64152 RepID=A0AA88MFU2_CHASR|nr:hypothetical protein Q5P01_014283 [Channa striata]
MEFITDITITVDATDFKDPGRLTRILQPYLYTVNGSCYKVRGTFQELDNLSLLLQGEDTLSKVKPVDVSVAVMDYINQKRAKDLSRIIGDSFVIDKQPVRNIRSTVQLTLRPRNRSIRLVQADLVRQRFITFYQRTASDLETTAIRVHSPQQCRDLEKRFPQVLFTPIHNNEGHYKVTGPFGHIHKLKDCVAQNAGSPRKDPVCRGPADRPSSKDLGASPTQSKDQESESCPICMETIVTTEKDTLRCKHSFCKSCLKQAFAYKPVCPTCGELYGTLTGIQPEGGVINVTRAKSSLPGYEKYGTIIIHYYIPSGIQKEEHPNPGQPYEGVSRTAYLPDSSEGNRILILLQRAFDQRLIFTVGRSTTSGRNNTVTWNDIHHKTSTHGGPTHYGYPDPDYLRRVRDELKVKGIE